MELEFNEIARAELSFGEVSAACAEAVLLISQDAERLESEVYKPDESWCVVTGEDPPDFNMAMVEVSEEAVDNMVAMVSILQGYNKPSILFSPTNGVELRTIAETAGLLHCGTTPLMELRCERFIPEETVGRVKVQEVANMQELGEAIKIQASALDFDEAVITRTMGEKVLEVPNVKVFVGRDEAEQPICTMTVVESEGIATIWNVGTLPEHQRQGYGRELMQEVLELYSGGKRPGIKAFYLMSSEAGLKLYNNLGFETVREYDTWLVGEEPVSE